MKCAKQFAKDADDVMGTLDNSWWENALELVPVAGDIYGSTKFVKQVTKAYDKLQDLENKYVGREKHILMLSAITPARGQSSAGSNIVSESDPVFEQVFEKANEDYQQTY